MASIRLISSASSELFSVADARVELLIADDDDGITDGELLEKIKDARGEVEDMSGHDLILNLYEYRADAWPDDDTIRLAKYPVKSGSVTITYYDELGALITLDANDYSVDTDSFPARIYLKETPDLEDDRLNAVRVEFSAGYEDITLIPRGLMRAFKLFLSAAWGNLRSDEPLSKGVNHLLTRAEQICLRHRNSIF